MLAPALCFAQKIHFSDTSNKWLTYYYFSQGASGGRAIYTNYYYADSMVMYNGHEYARLNVVNAGTSALVREEGNKVYIKPIQWNSGLISDTNEFVLYDYDMQVGDTLRMPWGDRGSFSDHKLISIDTTMINNVPHRVFRMKIVTGLNGEYWVTEGVGTPQGPLIITYQPGYATRVICFRNNGANPISSYMDCAHETETDAPILLNGFRIFPNPASEYVTINYTEAGSALQLDIIDLCGRKVKQAVFVDQIKLSVLDLCPGVYLLRLSNAKRFYKTMRLVVKH
jgi:hypothetical protein